MQHAVFFFVFFQFSFLFFIFIVCGGARPFICQRPFYFLGWGRGWGPQYTYAFSMHHLALPFCSSIPSIHSSLYRPPLFLQKTIMLFPPLPPHVHRLFCGVCNSLEASRAWWNRRRRKSSTDERDTATTCVDQDGDIAEEAIVYYDNPALNSMLHPRNPQSGLSRRGPQQVLLTLSSWSTTVATFPTCCM